MIAGCLLCLKLLQVKFTTMLVRRGRSRVRPSKRLILHQFDAPVQKETFEIEKMDQLRENKRKKLRSEYHLREL